MTESRVVLREVRDGDLPTLFEHQRDPDSTAMAGFPAREREAFDAHWAKIRADPECRTRAIVVDGRLAGNIGSWWQDDGRREVGYWLGREFWGRGIASRALAAYLREERERPLHAFVVRHNPASLRVLEKCGFTVAGERDGGFDLVLA